MAEIWSDKPFRLSPPKFGDTMWITHDTGYYLKRGWIAVEVDNKCGRVKLQYGRQRTADGTDTGPS